jgi:hypothetical protein
MTAKTGAAIIAVVVAVVAIAVTLAATLTGHHSGIAALTDQPAAPAPISRTELMTEYAKIAPFDATATPATIDKLAASICGKLEQGQSTDDLITSATQVYKAQATEVVRLLVSYACPTYLADFK